MESLIYFAAVAWKPITAVVMIAAGLFLLHDAEKLRDQLNEDKNDH